jgi:hypothetical protein
MISDTLALLSWIMTKLFAIFIIASCFVFAQETQATAVDERWEYCIAKAGWAGESGTGRLEGQVDICYTTEQGCRQETIRISDPIPAGLKPQYVPSQSMLVLERAVEKTLAQLGKDRWELVSVVYPNPRGVTPYSRAFYFKRRVR